MKEILWKPQPTDITCITRVGTIWGAARSSPIINSSHTGLAFPLTRGTLQMFQLATPRCLSFQCSHRLGLGRALPHAIDGPQCFHRLRQSLDLQSVNWPYAREALGEEQYFTLPLQERLGDRRKRSSKKQLETCIIRLAGALSKPL